jgi:Mannosyltransferase (PIG-V)
MSGSIARASFGGRGDSGKLQPCVAATIPASSYDGSPWRCWLWIGLIFLGSRGLLFLIMGATNAYFGTPSGLGQGLLSNLCRWDCGWYLDIAEHGYSVAETSTQPGATNFAFYPLFPLLVRLLAATTGASYLLAAVLVSNVCFIIALFLVYRYAQLIGLSERAALLAVALLAVLPLSIAFSAAYSESVFLLLLVVAILALRQGNFLVSGIAAALLSGSRSTGIFFIVFASIWAFRNAGWRTFVKPWRIPEYFVPVVFAPIGFFLFSGYCLLATGDAFAQPSTELYGWGWYFSAPWTNLIALARAHPLVGALGIGVFASSLLLLRKRLYEEFAFCAAVVLLIWSGGQSGSIFRYWLVLFPVWVVLAERLAARPIAATIVFSAALILNGWMTYAWTLQYPLAQ